MSSSHGDVLPRDPPSTSSTASSSSSSTSRSATPKTSPQANSDPNSFVQSPSSYFTYPVHHVVSGILRRLTEPSDPLSKSSRDAASNTISTGVSSSNMTSSSESSAVYTPHRTASPFQPPPLTPLTLSAATNENLQQQLLTRSLAEEIRLLVPPRLQLVDTWRLAYSLDRDGASLSTLYENCANFSHRSLRAGYVLVVRDASPAGAVFGGYLTDAPHPSPHYYGTGECFLWRASVLPPPSSHRPPPPPTPSLLDDTISSDEKLDWAGLPPPPSADTTHMGRSTTLRGENTDSSNSGGGNDIGSNQNEQRTASVGGDGLLVPPNGSSGSTQNSERSTPEPIRFKAFPYSGINDYMIFCETGFLSLGGGDGHFGLWLDSSLEKGVSAPALTFGNEPLSDEGTKFDIIGVEVWYVGA